MGIDRSAYKQEADALRYGMDLGMTLIDTAEMYNDAELVVADAIQGRRHEVTIVNKVLPGNASREGTIQACERSLKRLKIENIDVYLLHWAGHHPLEQTLEAFERLVEQGKIASYGVSNFNHNEIQQAWNLTGGSSIATNQVLYNLQQRGIEWDLLPWCRDHGMPVMAYCPLNQGQLPPDVLEQVALRHNATRFQIALAWLLQHPDIIVIPKASDKTHTDQNFAALGIRLTNEELKQIDRTFSPPQRATPLSIV